MGGIKIFTMNNYIRYSFLCHLRLYHPQMPPTSKCNASSRVRYRSTRKAHRAGGGSTSSRTTKHTEVSLQDVILLHINRDKKKFVTLMTYYLKCLFTQHNTEKRKHMIRSLNKLTIKKDDTIVKTIPVMYDPTHDDGAQFKTLAESIYEDKRFFVESRGTRLLSIWGPLFANVVVNVGSYFTLSDLILNGIRFSSALKGAAPGFWKSAIYTAFQVVIALKLSVDMGNSAEYVIEKHTLPDWGKTGKKRFESLFT